MSQIGVKQFYPNTCPVKTKTPLGYALTIGDVLFDVTIQIDGKVRIIGFN